MKFWPLALLFLIGCADTQYIPLRAPGPHVSSSFQDMTWVCEETDVNDALVWVRCEFRNNSPPIKNVCIKVIYSTRPGPTTSTIVAESRDICSGPLWAGGTNENYAAFFKENRKLLAQTCGPNLEKCFMATVLLN